MNKKCAVVTGASRGIGKAIAISLAKEGFDLAINASRSEEELFNTANEIRALGVDCETFLIDIKDNKAVEDMIENVVCRYGKIDVLVNNAGISKIGLLQDLSFSQWNEIINVNLTGVYNTCHAVIPHMVHEKCGKIINISSVWGNVGASCEVAYSATKGGVNAFTKALAKELAPSNIVVNAIACGAIDTAMNQFLNKEDRQALEEEIAVGRMGTSDEIAQIVSEIIKMPIYMTGQVITVDGGWQ